MSDTAKHAPSLALAENSRAAGATLHWKHWPVDGAPKASVLILHGYAEHLGRYQHVAAALNRAEYDVFALDHYGHGQSDGARAFVQEFSVYRDGLDALVVRARELRPQAQLVLLGHSMGGLIAAAALPSRQKDFAAVVLSGPAIKPVAPPSQALITISKVLSAIAPKLGVAGLDPNLVSRNPKVVADYISDPLVTKGKITARIGAEIFNAMAEVEQSAKKITLPILIMHGGADGLTAVRGSRDLHECVGSADKTLKIYDGLYHEIFNEPEGPAVVADMIAWIDARV